MPPLALHTAACAAAASGLVFIWLRRRQQKAAAGAIGETVPEWANALNVSAIAAARSSCRLVKGKLVDMLGCKDDYDRLLDACARNIKMGPFLATSGLELEYLLNAATNLMDLHSAPVATRMTLDVLQARFLNSEGGKILVVGGEVGGGIMAGQCAAMAEVSHPDVVKRCDFAYMRKKKKTSGTLQQLEAPNHITQRTPQSEPLRAVWLDETNSTGSELLKNVELLLRDYNILVIGAIFLVDRSRDRTELRLSMLWMAHPALTDVDAVALFDLEEIDARVQRVQPCMKREVSDVKQGAETRWRWFW